MQELMPYTSMEAFVTGQLATGSSFAVNVANTEEQIFIPSKIANMKNILPGDRIHLRAIPNRRPGNAKWFAIHVEAAEPDDSSVNVTPDRETQIAEQLAPLLEPVEPPAPDPAPDPARAKKRKAIGTENFDAVRKALAEIGGVGTTGEIAKMIGKSTSYTGFYLNSLHQKGELARAGIRNKADQKIDSFVFWAFNARDLTPFDPEEEVQ